MRNVPDRILRSARSAAPTIPRAATVSAALLLLFTGCRDRAFNADAKGIEGEESPVAAKREAPHYLACLSGQDWTIDFAPESQILTVGAGGKTVFKSEIKSHVDRALPVAHVHEAYGLRDAAHYARQEIVTELGNVTIDRVVDDGEPLQRTLLLAFRIEGDGIQRTVDCDVTSKVTWNGPKPAGVDKTRFTSLGAEAYAKAPRWSPLTRPGRAVIEEFREIAACEVTASTPPERWVAFLKEDVLVVGRASGETNASSLSRYLSEALVRAKVTKKIEEDAERDVEGTRYFVSSRTWRLEKGEDVRFEAFTERKQGGESLYRGSVWSLAGKTLRCAGQLGLLPPGTP